MTLERVRWKHFPGDPVVDDWKRSAELIGHVGRFECAYNDKWGRTRIRDLVGAVPPVVVPIQYSNSFPIFGRKSSDGLENGIEVQWAEGVLHLEQKAKGWSRADRTLHCKWGTIELQCRTPHPLGFAINRADGAPLARRMLQRLSVDVNATPMESAIVALLLGIGAQDRVAIQTPF